MLRVGQKCAQQGTHPQVETHLERRIIQARRHRKALPPVVAPLLPHALPARLLLPVVVVARGQGPAIAAARHAAAHPGRRRADDERPMRCRLARDGGGVIVAAVAVPPQLLGNRSGATQERSR